MGLPAPFLLWRGAPGVPSVPGSSWGVEDHPEPPQVPLAGGLDAPTTQEGGLGLTAWKSLLETSAFHLPFLEFLERNVFCLAGERYSFLVKEEP